MVMGVAVISFHALYLAITYFILNALKEEDGRIKTDSFCSPITSYVMLNKIIVWHQFLGLKIGWLLPFYG